MAQVARAALAWRWMSVTLSSLYRSPWGGLKGMLLVASQILGPSFQLCVLPPQPLCAGSL